MIEKKKLIDKIPHTLFFVVSAMIFILIVISVGSFIVDLIQNKDVKFLLSGVLHVLVLVELLHLTFIYALHEEIEPRELVLIVFTAVGRKLIAEDLFIQDPKITITIGAIFLICIYGLKVLSEPKIERF